MIPNPLPGPPITAGPAPGKGPSGTPAGSDPGGFLRLVTAASGGAGPQVVPPASAYPVTPTGQTPDTPQTGAPPVIDPDAPQGTVAAASGLPSAFGTPPGDEAVAPRDVSGQLPVPTAPLGSVPGPVAAQTRPADGVTGAGTGPDASGDDAGMSAQDPMETGDLTVANTHPDRPAPLPPDAPPPVMPDALLASAPGNSVQDRTGTGPVVSGPVLTGPAPKAGAGDGPRPPETGATGTAAGPTPAERDTQAGTAAGGVPAAWLQDTVPAGPGTASMRPGAAQVAARPQGPAPLVTPSPRPAVEAGAVIAGPSPDPLPAPPPTRLTPMTLGEPETGPVSGNASPRSVASGPIPDPSATTGPPGPTLAAIGPVFDPLRSDGGARTQPMTRVEAPGTRAAPEVVIAPGTAPLAPEGAAAGESIRRLATIEPVAGSVLPTWSRQTGPSPLPPPLTGPAEAVAAGAGSAAAAGASAPLPSVPAPPMIMTGEQAPQGPVSPLPPPVQAGPIASEGANEVSRRASTSTIPAPGLTASPPEITAERGQRTPPLAQAPTGPGTAAQPAGRLAADPVRPGPAPASAPPNALPAAPAVRSVIRQEAGPDGPVRNVNAGPAPTVSASGLSGPAPDGGPAPSPFLIPAGPGPLRTSAGPGEAAPAPPVGPSRIMVDSDPVRIRTGLLNVSDPDPMRATPIGPERAFADPLVARPEAPLAPTGTGSAPQTAPAEPGAPLSALLADRTALARHVSRHLRPPAPGEVRTQITLRPDGLGAVEVELSTDQTGRLSLLLRVENPIVLQAIRADRDLLLSGLERSGLELDGAQLGFEGFGPGGEPGREPRRGGPYRPATPLIPDGPEPAPARHRHTPLIGSGRLDLFT